MSLLELFAVAALAFWVGLALDRRRAWPDDLRLPATPAGDGDDPPEPPAGVAAVVPARDEADLLPRTLPALLDQDLPGLSVVVVDDGSSDGTAEAARAVARGDLGREARLTVIAPPPPPPGWSGKLHALARGIEAVESSGAEPPEWLLLTDADIHHRPGSLRALLAQAGAGGGRDLVSVMARLPADGLWERLLIPPFVFFFQLLYPFRRVGDPRSAVAAAAGGCILVRRRTLAAAGGVAAIRGALIDDVSLARRVKAIGGRLWLGFDDGIVSLRPYRRLGAIGRMVARTAFTQLGYRWSLLAVTLAGLALFVVSPPFLIAGAGVRLSGGAGGETASLLRAAAWAAAAWALQAWALRPAVRHHRVAAGWAWTLPLSAALYGWMTWISAWRHARGTGGAWKGRIHRRSEDRRPAS